MKILYGVQGTGNGHITRARSMQQHFEENGIDVDYLFSGRDISAYFDMAVFGNALRFKQGLTFYHRAGEIDILNTLCRNSLKTFWHEVNSLDLSQYDAVLTDFEPITAWAGQRQGVPVIGMGHQYAFNYNVPIAGESFISKQIMQRFAPTDFSLGLHWHHFDSPILPPIAEPPSKFKTIDEEKILVYFGFEDPEEVIQFLTPIQSHTFVIYGRFDHYQSLGHIQLKPLSREGFCEDLATCSGVISNAGFELSSEAIQQGKKLLVKPLKGQMEQLSNAKALEQLGLGKSMDTLNSIVLRRWLSEFEGQQIIYPNVAKYIVEWLAQGDWHSHKALSDTLWCATKMGGRYLQPPKKIDQNAA